MFVHNHRNKEALKRKTYFYAECISMYRDRIKFQDTTNAVCINVKKILMWNLEICVLS